MIRRVLACAMPLLLLACQNQSSPVESTRKTSKKTNPKPIYIGTVQQVYPDHNFALVRLARMVPKAGTTLISHPADGTNLRLGNLTVSAEKINNSVSRMIAADIRGGTVVSGDAVYIYENIIPNDAKKQEVADEIALKENDFFEDPIAAVAEVQAEAQDTEEQVPAWLDENETAPAPAPAITSPTPVPAKKTTSDPALPSFIKDIPDRIEGWE